jgi:hypothetical protein
MIRKPGDAMRRSFWRADAWAAARAERSARWHTPNPDYPIASRIVFATILLFALTNGPFFCVAIFVFLVVFIEGVALLRRVLMYWSIRRYGPWREMAPEMRAVIENPSDLAARPERFAPMPTGYTSTDDLAGRTKGPDWWRATLPLIFISLCLLTAMLVD